MSRTRLCRTGLVQDSRKYSIKNFEFDELLPGGGRFYCPETARHFINATALEAHKKTKEYKKRCRELKKTPCLLQSICIACLVSLCGCEQLSVCACVHLSVCESHIHWAEQVLARGGRPSCGADERDVRAD